MIKSREDYLYYLEEDRKAEKGARGGNSTPKLFGDDLWKYTRLMRKCEYLKNCSNNFVLRAFYLWNFKRRSVRYGFSIPLNSFGPGLKIIHRGTIVVNPGAKVGPNAGINCDVVIGAKLGTKSAAPIIGKNCYIACGAKIIGEISVGDNVIIGANAVVVKDVQDNVTVAGIPAKVISSKNTKDVFTYFVD